jgi:hypothetical protein
MPLCEIHKGERETNYTPIANIFLTKIFVYFHSEALFCMSEIELQSNECRI